MGRSHRPNLVRYNRAVHQTTSPDFLAVNDMLVERRDAQAAELAARAAARAGIADPVTRQIADMFGRSEARDAKVAHLASLARIAAAFPGKEIPGASERVARAFERARAQGNFSALEALERELDRDRDEEDTGVIFAMMN
jgi:hypothetical protein